MSASMNNISCLIAILTIVMSGKDKGGPSKGGFLNNILFSYTVLYLCNEIDGVYTNI